MNAEAVKQVKDFACHRRCSQYKLETHEESDKICAKDIKSNLNFWIQNQCLLFEMNCLGDRGKQKNIIGTIATIEM